MDFPWHKLAADGRQSPHLRGTAHADESIAALAAPASQARRREAVQPPYGLRAYARAVGREILPPTTVIIADSQRAPT